MAVVPSDILDKWEKADRIRQEFYKEKAKVDILLHEVLCLCNNVSVLRTKKKSEVRSQIRPKVSPGHYS